MNILGIDSSPNGPGKTARIVSHVLEGAAGRGAEVALIRHDAHDAVARIGQADAVVLGSPTYRGSHCAAMRALLERIGRDKSDMPLAATPALVVMTGASPAHFLGTDALAGTLSGFFGTQVLSPSLYFHPGHFTPTEEATEEAMTQCRIHGEALWELATAVKESTALRLLEPLV
jgi:FMN reductase